MEGMEIKIRKAVTMDIDRIKFLSEKEKHSLGFMTKATYLKYIEAGNVLVVTVDDTIVGFQLYYHRKRDLQTTLYQKTIDKNYRNLGLAKLLVDEVIKEAKVIGHNKISLKCPEDLASNKFHEKIGFHLIGQEIGKKRKLNIWQMDI